MAELKTFVFTDICRSVDLKNEMSGRSVTERDMAFIQKILIPHRERIEANLAENTGRVVSTAGDGHFLVFNNTILAATWAAEVQKSHQDDPIDTPGGGKVEVRISMHVGVPQVDPAAPDNFVGKSVDYASRLNDHATGGQILVSRSVMAILDDIGLEGISFHLHGRRNLKGIGHVEVHEMLYDDHGPRPLRQQPSSNSDRQWTVIPTGLGGGGQGESRGSAVADIPMLKRVGNYELEAMLGSGGMGDVYKGRHTQFGRLRAIKVIKPQFISAGNDDVIRRFYQEIKAIGTLEHRNVVVAIDSSSPADRLHYLVMEYIDGVSVQDLVEQRGRLSVADACEIVRQAARGLQYIHRNGMVHRDIKPSNLMITLMDSDGVAGQTSSDPGEPVEGVVKILDLGLALLAGDSQERLTRYDHKAMGTGMYMSPEQWKTTSVDIRADIYSLGCTLYHLLSGNPPFHDSELRPEKAHEKSRVPPIRTNNVPRKLWDIIEKMLAKKPEDRYATPAEVAAELTPFCEGHNLTALVHGYLDPGSHPSALQYTRIDSGAQFDTRSSKRTHASWVSEWSPSRRWVLQRGLPFLAVLVAIGGLFWSMQQSRQQTIAIAMEQARNNLPSSAEQAAKIVGAEIEKRFAILQSAASEAAVIYDVEYFDADKAREDLQTYRLAEWIREHRQNNMDTARSDSWFIVDLEGKQIARHPLIDPETRQPVDSFLQNYAHRDYFHGQGKELPEIDPLSEEVAVQERVTPIQEPNISSVYLSSTTGKLRVAFSVPIWTQPTAEETRKVIGVLAMSVDLGDFEVLNTNLQRGKDIVLVDLRNDYLVTNKATGESIPERGLILNHPLLSVWKDKDNPPRVSPQVLTAMDANTDHFIAGYHDPLSINPETTYWGAFQAVEYKVQDVMTETPKVLPARWMVLVQQPAIEL
jgi:serine/threonine protein kinase